MGLREKARMPRPVLNRRSGGWDKTSANSGILGARQHIQDPMATYSSVQRNSSRVLLGHPANDFGIPSLRMIFHHFQQPVSLGWGADRYELALVGKIQRIESEQLADTSYTFSYRDPLFFDNDSRMRLEGYLIQGGSESPSCRIAQTSNRRARLEHFSHQIIQRRAITHQNPLECEPFPLG
jgi:hypothetical protein